MSYKKSRIIKTETSVEICEKTVHDIEAVIYKKTLYKFYWALL